MRVLTLLMLVLFTCAACSKEQAQRAAFETLQNIETQRCDDRLVDGCQEGDSFDSYQRQRQEVVGPQE